MCGWWKWSEGCWQTCFVMYSGNSINSIQAYLYNINLQQLLSTLMANIWEIGCTRLHQEFIGQHVVKVCGQSVCYESAQDHGRTSMLFSWRAALNSAAEAAGIHTCSLLKTVVGVAMSLGPGIWCRGSRSCLLLSCMLWDMLVVVASSYWSRDPQQRALLGKHCLPLSHQPPVVNVFMCVHAWGQLK